MSDHPSGHEGSASEGSASEGSGAEGLGSAQAHEAPAGAGSVQPRFPDPGLPPHRHRMTDIDPRAARRAERQVTTLFLLSVLGTLLFMVGYFAVQLTSLGAVGLSTRLLGGGLGLSLFAIGIGAVHWAKTLMSDKEIVEERHPARSDEQDRAAAAAIIAQGNAESGFGRRKMIRNSLATALGALGLPAIVSLRDMGPLPGTSLDHTAWKKGIRLVTDPTGQPIKPEDVPVGGIVHVLPEGVTDLDQRAKAASIVIRLEPEQALASVPADRRDWVYAGIVCYSLICTHVGCPVGLYEQQSHHLLCPCHQSTFDVLNHCKVIFGPAARSLPQLAITVNSDGYLVAQHDYTEPVGPSFWERS